MWGWHGGGGQLGVPGIGMRTYLPPLPLPLPSLPSLSLKSLVYNNSPFSLAHFPFLPHKFGLLQWWRNFATTSPGRRSCPRCRTTQWAHSTGGSGLRQCSSASPDMHLQAEITLLLAPRQRKILIPAYGHPKITANVRLFSSSPMSSYIYSFFAHLQFPFHRHFYKSPIRTYIYSRLPSWTLLFKGNLELNG